MKNLFKKVIITLKLVSVFGLCSMFVGCNYELDCFHEDCNNPICEKSHLFCEEHVCHSENCGDKAKHPPYGNYCWEHECKNSNCEKQKFEISRSVNTDGKLKIEYCDFCYLHKCYFENCFEEGDFRYENKNVCQNHFSELTGWYM